MAQRWWSYGPVALELPVHGSGQMLRNLGPGVALGAGANVADGPFNAVDVPLVKDEEAAGPAEPFARDVRPD
jgi:hypothetical protein